MTPKGPFQSKLICDISIASSHKSWSKERKAKISLTTPHPVTAAFNAALILANPAAIPALMQRGLKNFEQHSNSEKK